jgi:hypothetical protein
MSDPDDRQSNSQRLIPRVETRSKSRRRLPAGRLAAAGRLISYKSDSSRLASFGSSRLMIGSKKQVPRAASFRFLVSESRKPNDRGTCQKRIVGYLRIAE